MRSSVPLVIPFRLLPFRPFPLRSSPRLPRLALRMESRIIDSYVHERLQKIRALLPALQAGAGARHPVRARLGDRRAVRPAVRRARGGRAAGRADVGQHHARRFSHPRPERGERPLPVLPAAPADRHVAPRRVRPAPRLLRAPANAPALVLPRQPHGRFDGARDERHERRAPARRPDGHVHAPDLLRRPLHPAADAADQLAPHADAAGDDAARLAHRQILRPAGAHALREDSGVLLAHLGARAGELLGRARRARLRAGGRGGRGLQRPQPPVRRAQPRAGARLGGDAPAHPVGHRFRASPDRLVRRHARRARRDYGRPVRRVQPLPDAPHLASDRARLRRQPLPARHGEPEAAELDPRRRAGDCGPSGRRASSRPSAGASSSAASPSATASTPSRC